MARGRKKKETGKDDTGANLGFEEKLWAAADKLRGHMDASEYKHVVLGLIFLKYVSDAFQEKHEALKAAQETEYTDPEDRDGYTAENVFWVPKNARWPHLQANAKQPTIGKLVDDAMVAIEKENPALKGVLPKDYARPALDKTRLGEVIDLIGTIGLGDEESRSKDILGRVYEYFLSRFANAEGKKGREFYTPRCIVKLLVEMIEPYKGRVYDPCCGSSGMFVQSEEFILAHGGRIGDISIYGQESNHTTWRLAKMNLAIRGLEANLGPHQADSFQDDLHKDLKADFLLANPPFNDSDWGGDRLQEDVPVAVDADDDGPGVGVEGLPLHRWGRRDDADGSGGCLRTPRDLDERLEDPSFLAGLQQDLEPVAPADLSNHLIRVARTRADVSASDLDRQRLGEQGGGNKD
jgi:type I restriction enzyme M protein